MTKCVLTPSPAWTIDRRGRLTPSSLPKKRPYVPHTSTDIYKCTHIIRKTDSSIRFAYILLRGAATFKLSYPYPNQFSFIVLISLYVICIVVFFVCRGFCWFFSLGRNEVNRQFSVHLWVYSIGVMWFLPHKNQPKATKKGRSIH